MAKNNHTRITKVDPDSVTFGVEIECYLPTAKVQAFGIQIGDRHCGIPLRPPFIPGWRAEKDGSLTHIPNYTAIEIVSPPLAGHTGLLQMCEAYHILNSWGAIVNTSCGLHVHVGMRSVLGERANDFALVTRWVRRLVHLVSVHEPALIALTGEPARANNRYCQSIKPKWEGKLTTATPLTTLQQFNDQPDPDGRAPRYHTLNLCNLFSAGEKCTVEFRAFAGTLDWLQGMGCVAACLGLCQRAAEQGTAPNYDTSPANWAQAQAYVASLHKLLWAKSPRYGWPTLTFAEYGERVMALQLAQAVKFAEAFTV
jgi:hypothetical protein